MSLMIPMKDETTVKKVIKRSPKPSPQPFKKPRSGSFQKHSILKNPSKKESQEKNQFPKLSKSQKRRNKRKRRDKGMR